MTDRPRGVHASLPVARAAGDFSRGAFRRWMLVDAGYQPITVQKRLEKLERAVERGFDLHLFARTAEDAVEAGRSYLAERKAEATVHAYGHDVRLLNSLARYLGFERDARFKKQKDPRVQLRALNDADVRQLFTYRGVEEEGTVLRRALLAWALKSGMRPSEIAAMTVDDLDRKRSRFHVRKPAKRGLRRWLPIEPWMWSPKRPFGAYLARRVDAPEAPGALWTTTRYGGDTENPHHGEARPMTPESLRTALYDVGHATGVHVNFNIARHTRGTELRRMGWDVLAIKVYLGHSSVKSTEIYAELRPDELGDMLKARPGRDFFADGFGGR